MMMTTCHQAENEPRAILCRRWPTCLDWSLQTETKMLLELRDEYKSLHETENSFFFFGVAAGGGSFEGDGDKSEEVYRYVMSHVIPDAVLYRSSRTDHDLEIECNYGPPSMWIKTNDSSPSTMSFEAALMLRRMSIWPSTLVQMMSFSPAVAYITDSSSAFWYGHMCDGYYLKPASFKCAPENPIRDAVPTTSPNGMDIYRIGADPTNEAERRCVAYDDATMERKMCKTNLEHGFSGGWAMLHLEYSILDRKGCGDLNYTGNYQQVQLLRDLMKRNFTAKDCP
ncbi:uncharacterized protein LOC135392247 [Ornithodoros turicata]|uniref:uncharacterized protein LOC135392247 n=1 Tax=Ornithodoros turicata TaxID=34597 RepID=UPI003138AEDF